MLTFLTRIGNLLSIPIFTDEAIYIRWAQIGLADPAHRFIALTDGKQPLLTWFMYPLLPIFSDPLVSGRMVSVIAASFACIGMYFVGKVLFGRTVGILSALFYLLSPFTLVYDRLALMDSLLGMFGIWSIFLSIFLAKKLRLDVALLLGIVSGFGALTKSSAFFFIFNLPLAYLLFPKHTSNRGKGILKFIGLSLISILIVQLMYNLLRLSPWFYLIRQKNYSFVLTISEFLQNPFSLFVSNLHGLIPWIFGYLTIPISILIFLGIVIGFYKRDKALLYLFFWFFIPFVFLAAFGKVIFPRFLLFMSYPLLIIGANEFFSILEILKKKKIVRILFFSLIIVYPLIDSFLLITDPVKADIPKNDRNQLMDDWPSGYGVREVVSFLDQQSKYGKVVIGTEGTFGLFPAVFEIYLKSNPNIEIYGYWPVSEVPAELLLKAQSYPTYLVFKEKQKIPESWPLKLLAKYRRGGGDTYLLFYQVVGIAQ